MDKATKGLLGIFLLFGGIFVTLGSLYYHTGPHAGHLGQINWAQLLVGVLCIIVGYKLLAGASKESARESALKCEARARSRIRAVYTKAGYEPDEVEERAKLTEMLLKEGAGDWTQFGTTKLPPIIQAVDALRKKQ